ncbi:PilW family protein [Melaminivora alkalimesophila]|uniref:Type IV pilus assembly protein PilW n=1 Tax=Melaminivora alkalimesophila TaxID=1165852 RepID=A0A317RFE5_9BURK|nr:PilW family protein [Melaminivora alkalimesophila]PWW48619.1 type IV pilus assembly protein PilW [Melaminivora alkalimesophila]
MHPPLRRYSEKPTPHAQTVQGFTLLELLISLTIGLVILAASLQAYVSSSRNSRISQLETQLNEDGILALNLIQQQVKQAGYSQQLRPASESTVMGNYSGLAVRGCDHGFDNVGAPFDNLSCKSGPGPAALAIRYEATPDNTSPTNAGDPTNCIGNGILRVEPSQVAPAINPPAGPYALADNRYFVKTNGGQPSLSCQGTEKSGSGANAIGSAQPLLPDVEDMVIRYGIATQGSLELASSYDVMKHQIIKYATAAEIDALPSSGTITDPTQDRWSRVLSVRICVIMRSELPVQDAPDGAMKYKDCENVDRGITDNYLRRAFTTTVLLRNRLVTPP